MNIDFACHINYFAVLGASVAYFILGSFWFSPALFGSIWRQELENHNLVIGEPTSAQLFLKMGITFASTVVTSLGLACLIDMIGSTTALSGLYLGMITSICFVVTSVATVFSWESRSMTLFLIDVGYPVIGILASSVILSLWH